MDKKHNVFVTAVRDYTSPRKRGLEQLWASNMGLPADLMQFSHLDGSGNGIMPSGLVFGADGVTVGVMHNGDEEPTGGVSMRVNSLQKLGTFGGVSRSNPSFVERSALLYSKMYTEGSLSALLPEPANNLTTLNEGVLDSDNPLVMTVQNEKSVSFVHRAGCLFDLRYHNVPMATFYDAETYRRAVREAFHSGMPGSVAHSILPAPSNLLNRFVAKKLGMSSSLLTQEWSGVSEYVLPLGHSYALVTDFNMTTLHLAHYGRNIAVVDSAEQLSRLL